LTYHNETLQRNRQSWNALSANYQAHTRISTSDVHYGPLAPGERELGLLGEVAGKRILEVGCGGGQNSIALAKQGAICVGIDPSSAQLAHAQKLAQGHGVDVQFLGGVAEDLGVFCEGSFDLVLSSYAFGYVTDLTQAYREAWRVLKPGGLFVFCLSHPWFQAVGWYLAGEPDAPEIKDYAAWPDLEEWDWSYEDGTSVRMQGYLRTLEQVVNELIETGFVLERLVEQHTEAVPRAEDVARAAPKGLSRFPYVNEFDPSSKLYQVERKLPHTLILRARKPGALDR
jgi:ubiquinone/menaquinone biosynthesis C-methylase UbiE